MVRNAAAARVTYGALAALTIGIGLWVDLGATGLGADARDILGDALWAVMMMWLLGAAAPRLTLVTRAALACAICAAVELSQLFHAPAIDALRATTPGHLVLGSGFDARDLLAYAAGVGAAAALESAARRAVRRAGRGERRGP